MALHPSELGRDNLFHILCLLYFIVICHRGCSNHIYLSFDYSVNSLALIPGQNQTWNVWWEKGTLKHSMDEQKTLPYHTYPTPPPNILLLSSYFSLMAFNIKTNFYEKESRSGQVFQEGKCSIENISASSSATLLSKKSDTVTSGLHITSLLSHWGKGNCFMIGVRATAQWQNT